MSSCGNRTDGQWRFVFTDLDRGFSGSTNDDIADFTQFDNDNYDYARTWIRHARENTAYAKQFARFTDHLHTTFHPERVTSVIDEWADYIAPEVPQHVERRAPRPHMATALRPWNLGGGDRRLTHLASERSPFMLDDLASNGFDRPCNSISNLPLRRSGAVERLPHPRRPVDRSILPYALCLDRRGQARP